MDAHVSVSPFETLTGLQIVHGFGLSREQIRSCRAAGAKVALSTIYWSLAYTRDQRPWQTRVRFGLALLRASLGGHYRDKCRAMTESLNEMRMSFEMADVLLPNSQSEAVCIEQELGVTTPMHVVPNAVDGTLFSALPPSTPRPIDVLYCGRFEPHKNQFGFIRELRATKLRVVVAGPAHPDHPTYYRQCQKEATGNVSILPGLPHEQLHNLYRQAVVHALPSWYETTGLVSLEAGLCGCNVVTTDRGFAREYFGDKAWYCDPARPATIRQAVLAAHAAPVDPELREHVLRNYTWEHTARATLAAYEQVLVNSWRATHAS